MWNSVIETAKYPHREIKQTIKLHTTSSLCCFITFPACFGATWGRPTARKNLMTYLFICLFLFLPFYLSSSSFIFWRPLILYIYFFFFLFCILVLTLFFPSLLFYVLFFISFLPSLYCSIISYFFSYFLIHIPLFNLLPELEKNGA